MGDEVDLKNSKGDFYFGFHVQLQNPKSKIQIPDGKIKILSSQSNTTLEFVPEEARLLIADEDDQLFFQIRWVLQMCQDFNSQDFELIIVSAVCIAIQALD